MNAADRGLAAVLLSAAVALVALTGQSVAYTAPFNLQEVAPGNFVHLGKHVTFEDPDHDDIANIGFVVGEKCVAVIDTGGSVTVAGALKSAIREHTQAPICYVINTHVHFDHVLGNVVFRDDKPSFVGHAALAGALDGSRGFLLENFRSDLGKNATEADIIGPDKAVEDTLELDLGGRKLLLKAYPKAHTTTDITVLDERSGTLWLGDLLFRERIPSLDGSLKGWLAVIDMLEQQQGVRVVVPGHGAVGDSLQTSLAEERKYLQMLAEEVRPIIAEGGTLEQAMDKVGASERDHWQLWDQHHKRNVSRAFTELEWE
ncbi:MAG: quinoprotein relay system zinc metallohydrolase 2 [Chromatiales bacterium]